MNVGDTVLVHYGAGRFVARVALGPGPELLSVVAQRTDGSRMRGLFAIDPR